MTTTTVPSGTTQSNTDVTSGNELDVLSGGTANTTTVENGGNQTVESGGTETGAVIRAGGTETINGTINASNVVTQSGSASGDDDFGTITVNSGGTISNVTIEKGGTLALAAKSASANTVTVLTGGSLTINGNAPANNVTLQGGTLELISAKADSTNTTAGIPTASGTLTFAANVASRLQLDAVQTGTNGTTFAQTITGFAPGDVIDLAAITGGTITTTTSGNNTTVTVTGTGTTPPKESFTFVNTPATGFAAVADPNGGTDLVVCFAAGTLIRTARGDIAVEDLTVGDLVVTASGTHRPIRWLGSRAIDCRRHPRPHEVMPVRVAAGAFGEERPARDLVVSPGHALCVDVLGEVLIPAMALINGTTIVQEDVDQITYWHVELDSHEIIVAENMPAESYLDMGNRPFFGENGVVDLDASPDAPPATHADFCRPFHAEGVVVEAVRAQLRARAEGLGWRLEQDALGGMHLVVDGRRIAPAGRGLTARFTLPETAREVWLMSRTAVPAEVAASTDRRALGLYVGALIVDDGYGTPRRVEASDPLLGVGFQGAEGDGVATARWTVGRARVPAALWDTVEGDFFLRVELAGPALPRWVAPVGTGAEAQAATPLALIA